MDEVVEVEEMLAPVDEEKSSLRIRLKEGMLLDRPEALPLGKENLGEGSEVGVAY